MASANEVAEDLQGYATAGPGTEREDCGWAILTNVPGRHPYFRTVTRIRADSTPIDDMINHATEWFRQRGRTGFTWFLGPSTRPLSLAATLRDHGNIEDEPIKAMVLRGEPPIAEAIEVQVVENRDQFTAWRNIAFEMEDQPEHVRLKFARSGDAAWEAHQANPTTTAYLSFLDGQPAAAGMLMLTDQPGIAALQASAALHSARGHGCYRALVRARYEQAVAMGRPTLVTQASPRSRPILERLGFDMVGAVTIFHHSLTK